MLQSGIEGTIPPKGMELPWSSEQDSEEIKCDAQVLISIYTLG